MNDTLGHAAGDVLLKMVADRHISVAGDRNIVARLGGDEFAILHVTDAGPGASAALAARAVEVLCQRYDLGGEIVKIGASIGVALAPLNGETPELLLRNADLALYKAKSDGKGVFRNFDPELERLARERRHLEADLRKALAADEFEVHYQPLTDARTHRVTGAEALVRWRHPRRGLVSPADFIPIAEETGLIGALGRWVLRTACAQAALWPANMRVAVNLSPEQFRDPRLVELVCETLATTGLAADRLELEITEGVLLLEEERTLATMTRFRDLGIGLAMDDFGTGYSSLSYLRRFPFSKVKVDRAFVRSLPGDAESAAIVQAIVALAGCLGMSTTVEGVETAEQYAFAVAERCDQIQGFYVSRPLPAVDFLSFVGMRAAA